MLGPFHGLRLASSRRGVNEWGFSTASFLSPGQVHLEKLRSYQFNVHVFLPPATHFATPDEVAIKK